MTLKSPIFCDSQYTNLYQATNIYNLLIEEKITESLGKITFDFLNISINISEKSAIGDLFQEWFLQWLVKKNIYFRIQLNTQEFPDFLLNPQSNTEGLLEVKTFDITASANFDVANFESYCRSLKTQAYRLDADYLIFGYELINYRFKIKKVWLKKIWEITTSSRNYPIKSQIKQNVIYNIRPASWYSNQSTYKPFSNRKNFVNALYQTLLEYPKTRDLSKDWFNIVIDNYYQHTKELL
jgi:NgoBV restriction endonuclease